jgi:cyclophilin family peptidyl-prolyl cis-trans isomerase
VSGKKRAIERKKAKVRRTLMVVGAVAAVAVLAGAYVVFSPGAGGPSSGQQPAYAVITTQSGTIVFRFIEDKAPITSANFIGLVQSGYYNGLTWHRVEPNFVIQTGNKPSDPRPTIPLELHPELHNDYATVGVARTSDPNSGSTQFYINTDPGGNRELDTTGGGYAVFGVVTRGMDVAVRVPQGEQIFSITFQRSATPP